MTSSDNKHELFDEIHDLVTSQLGGTMTAEQVERLEQLVLGDDDTRRIYVQYIQETVFLRWHGAGKVPAAAADAVLEGLDVEKLLEAKDIEVAGQRIVAAIPQVSPSDRRRRRRRSPAPIVAVVVGVLVVATAFLGSWLSRDVDSFVEKGSERERTTSAGHLATLTEVSGTWAEATLEQGDPLPDRRLTLTDGFAEVTFRSGAVVVVEGPATFEVTGPEQMAMADGRLLAKVPPEAAGFRVATPSAWVTDLGCEFGVTCDAAATEIHVFEGAVEGESRRGDPDTARRMRLAGSEAARFDASGQCSQIPLAEATFARAVPTRGLLGAYYDSEDLTDLVETRLDPQIDFHEEKNWGDAPTGTRVVADDFYSERWVGFVKIDRPGKWTFHTVSNDGVRLWVAGKLIIKDWTHHIDKQHNAAIKLDAGWHPIRLEHYQHELTVAMQLSFSGPEQEKTIIPPSHLSAVNPMTGEQPNPTQR